MHKRLASVVMALVIGLLLCALTLGWSFSVQDVAFGAAPTPVTISDSTTNVTYPVYLCRDIDFSASGQCNPVNLATHNLMDLQWIVDMPTVNTTTLKLQHSIDGINWNDGVTLATGITTDTTGLNQFPNYGIYTRIAATCTTTDTLTVTVVGIAK